MPFIEMHLGDAQVKTLAEEGTHLVRIDKVDIRDTTDPNKRDQKNVMCTCSFPERPNTKTLWHTIAGIDSTERDDPDKCNNKYLMTIGFLELFNIEWMETGYNTEDLLGAEAEVRIGLEEGQDGITRNRINFDW